MNEQEHKSRQRMAAPDWVDRRGAARLNGRGHGLRVQPRCVDQYPSGHGQSLTGPGVREPQVEAAAAGRVDFAGDYPGGERDVPTCRCGQWSGDRRTLATPRDVKEEGKQARTDPVTSSVHRSQRRGPQSLCPRVACLRVRRSRLQGPPAALSCMHANPRSRSKERAARQRP